MNVKRSLSAPVIIRLDYLWGNDADESLQRIGVNIMTTKRKWTAQEKLAIVLDGLKSRPIKEICREYGISETQYYRWRDQAIEGIKDGFRDKRQKHNRSWEAERDRLLKLIGKQQLIIDLQKKISGAY